MAVESIGDRISRWSSDGISGQRDISNGRKWIGWEDIFLPGFNVLNNSLNIK